MAPGGGEAAEELGLVREDRQFVAVRLLSMLGSDAAPAAAGLVSLLRQQGTKPSRLRQPICATLARIGPEAAPYVDELQRILDQTSDGKDRRRLQQAIDGLTRSDN